ncbi:NAD(P)/FAD-dependent oxidoreductase [Echinicola soli]|uniref:NAD(P)/FAD-dependent oxidoreductase n=1 Tax=Echinicola soli TaxID=2591634 RepID=A0A514CH11_9BACT|nr:NAD(P)/FAD-dependent oxidoreductase [Echinicola soli]QDH79111.1 NAD(P)/FAD-dependent oxidoreductase [Echinicola soli]
MKEIEYVIIGAGQCGLSAGRYLQKANKDFIILDQHLEVGDSWRNRYESLKLFTPAAYCQLPDLKMALPPNVRPTKNQLADYFSRYASHFNLPIHTKNRVAEITKTGETFFIKTTFEEIKAKKVIVANGLCQKPFIPEWAEKLNIPYIHSSQYRTPISVKGKKVLVVGGGNSAAQIIADLTSYFDIHWSTLRKPKLRSLTVLGKNILWWGDKFNRLEKAPKVKKINKSEPVYLFDELKKSIRKAKRQPEVIGAGSNQVTFSNQKTEQFEFVLFATGFLPDYSFVNIEGFENDMDTLRKQHGISKIAGLYFLGIPFQRSRSSHLIYGSQRDAEFIVRHAKNPV